MNDDNPNQSVDLWALSLDGLSNAQREQEWRESIRPLGPDVFLPAFLKAFPRARKSQTRAFLIFSSMRYAQTHEEAYQLGVAGLNDRSGLVRYRACMLLACSLRKDTLPLLKASRSHPDAKTAQDVEAAIAAILSQNHHRFVDRTNSGRVFLEFSTS